MGAHSLFVDGNTYPIKPVSKPQLVNGLVNSFYELKPDLVQMIKEAKTVGVALQWSYAAPVFLGFEGMEVGNGRTKLLGYLALFEPA
jgi:hypothetical protein